MVHYPYSFNEWGESISVKLITCAFKVLTLVIRWQTTTQCLTGPIYGKGRSSYLSFLPSSHQLLSHPSCLRQDTHKVLGVAHPRPSGVLWVQSQLHEDPSSSAPTCCISGLCNSNGTLVTKVPDSMRCAIGIWGRSVGRTPEPTALIVMWTWTLPTGASGLGMQHRDTKKLVSFVKTLTPSKYLGKSAK